MEKKFSFIALIALSVIVLDQITKLAVSSLNQSIPIIKNIFHITLVHNYGAGFGILQNQQWLLIWISIIVLGLLFFYYDKIPAKAAYWVFLGLIIGGIIGNLIDRMAFGYVVDFLDFRVWPVFNVADTSLCTGAIGLIVWEFKK